MLLGTYFLRRLAIDMVYRGRDSLKPLKPPNRVVGGTSGLYFSLSFDMVVLDPFKTIGMVYGSRDS